jgi:hypothetical protein
MPPDGEVPTDGEIPPDGEVPTDGEEATDTDTETGDDATQDEMPPKPGDDATQDEMPPKPSDDATQDEMPPKPGDDATQDEMPPKPGDDATQDEMPPKPSDDATQDEMPPKPGDDATQDEMPPKPGDDATQGEMPPKPGDDATQGEMPPGMDTDATAEKSGVYEQNGGSATESDTTYSATETDESAIYIYGEGVYTLSDATLDKTGDTSSEGNSNFYGNNAVALAQGGSTVNLSGCTLTSDADGANAAFAYEAGTVMNLNNCEIVTTGGSSRGVDATYGGEINVSDSAITTSGAHCGGLATDRYDTTSGAPIINADNVVVNTSGQGSPGIYCTGTFDVRNSTLTASGSECAVVEGSNSITLTDTDLFSTADELWGVMIYQSMSGDALGNTGTFTMTGGTLSKTNGGPLLMNTNDEGYFNLTSVELVADSGIILKSCKCDWGAEATNGGVTHLVADTQIMNGDFIVDDYGDITASLTNDSYLKGAIDPDNAAGPVSLTLDATSSWLATADSYVDELEGVEFSEGVPTNVDAPSGVTITYGSGSGLSGDYTLASGGVLQLVTE